MWVVPSDYYILDSSHPEMMLLVPPADPSVRDGWLLGKPFQKPPKQPVSVRIRPGHEHGVLLDFFGTARLMSSAFYEALANAGVSNLEVYDAVLRSSDGSSQYEGYKAFNLIGLVDAADLTRSRFNEDVRSRSMDASIESLTIDPDRAQGHLMFRLKQYAAAVVVHQRLREAIEARAFPNVIFREPSEFLS
jgi:hypothetical protein